MKKILFLLLVISPFFISAKIPTNRMILALEKEAYSIASIPEWAKPYSFEKTNLSPIECPGGERVLLLSHQIEVASQTVFTHGVKQIVNEMGAQKNAFLQVPFDPEYEKVKFHRLIVWRDNEAIDLLDSVDFDVIQQEQELENFLYNGRLSLVAFLSDIQVGDIIEYAFSHQGANPVFNGKYTDSFSFHKREPIDHLVYRLIVPKDKKLHRKFFSKAPEPKVTELADGGQEWLWDENFPPSPVNEEGAPAWYDPSPMVEVSEFGSWEECANWADGLFETTDKPSEALLKLVQKLSKHQKPEERAVAALRYVQDKIRYMGIEVGHASHQPADPNEVLKRGYGDCKDKVFLLHTLLNMMEIESYPSLVNTILGPHVRERLPNPLAFNHVILSIIVDGKTYWVDPTVAQQGGPLSSHSCLVHGLALRLKAGDRDLSPITCSTSEPQIEIDTTYELSLPYSGAKVTIETQVRGEMADKFRMALQKNGRQNLVEHFDDSRSRQLGSSRIIEPIQIKDDRSRNIITLVELYDVENVWGDSFQGPKSFRGGPFEIMDTIPQVPEGERTAPLSLHTPISIKERVHVKGLPHNRGSYQREFKAKALFCKVKIIPKGSKSIDYEYDFKVMANYLDAKDIERHRVVLQEIMEALPPKLLYNVKKYRLK